MSFPILLLLGVSGELQPRPWCQRSISNDRATRFSATGIASFCTNAIYGTEKTYIYPQQTEGWIIAFYVLTLALNFTCTGTYLTEFVDADLAT